MAIERYAQDAPLTRSESLARRILASFDNNAGNASPPPVIPFVEIHSGAGDTLVHKREPGGGRDNEIGETLTPGEVQVFKARASRETSTRVVVSRQGIQHRGKFDKFGVNSTL